ncbi:MAG: DNA polymerase III subunit delta [Pyrinomonadaceae bacterium]|nr:DNA polymerase III subunit delta [Pyrinomonadaceae bacterium]
MSTATREELRRALKAKQLEPLYLLYGEEEFLRDAAARHITDAALSGAPLREFNEATFSLASTDVQQAIAAAEQLPMMSERRVVRVSDFGKMRETDEETLVRYITRPVASTIMIFTAPDLDKRRKLSKQLLDVCVSVEFAALRDVDLMAWARSYLKELKVTANERTLGLIVALVGSSTRRLNNELNKLAVAAAETKEITPEMVDALVGRSRELSNFELTDHLVARDARSALRILRTLLDDGAEPLMLLGLVASHYHRLLLAKELMAGGAAESEVFRLVPLPFNKRADFLASARRSNTHDLAKRIERIARTDVAIKTSLGGGGEKGSRLQIEMLVCELAA